MRRLTALPKAIWWITGTQIALLILYAILLPTYRAPDEPEHFDLVRHVASEASYPPYDGLQLDNQTVASLRETKLGQTHLDADAIVGRSERPTFAQLAPRGPSDRPNRMPQHPPLFYALTGALYALATAMGLETLSYDVVVVATRLTGILVGASLPLLAFGVAHRLTHRRSAGLAAAVVLLAIPQYTHIVASVNNDGLWILLASVVTYLGVRVLTGDRTLRTSMLIGLAVGLALLTKAFALILPIWLLIVYGVAARRQRDIRHQLLRLLQAGAVAAAVGGWWWLRNFAINGRLQASVPIYRDPQGAGDNVLFWAKTFVTWLTESFWGWMGFFEAKLPVIVIAAATLLVVATLAVGFLRRSQHPDGPSASTFVVLLSLGALVVPIVAVRAWNVYADTGITAGIQGRYLFPGVVALAAVLGVVWTDRRPDSPLPPVAATVFALGMQLAGIATVMRTYYGAETLALTERISTWLHWSPLAEWATITVVAVAVGSLLITAIVVAGSLGAFAPRQLPQSRARVYDE